MVMTRAFVLLAAVATCAASARPLAAQEPADTTLARAVATVLSDSVLVRRASARPVVWDHAATPLDSAVARIVTRDARLNFRERGSVTSLHVGIPRAAVGDGGAHVTVHEEQQYALAGDLTFYIEENDYVFERTGDGWRFVRRVRLSHADGGEVRG